MPPLRTIFIYLSSLIALLATVLYIANSYHYYHPTSLLSWLSPPASDSSPQDPEPATTTTNTLAPLTTPLATTPIATTITTTTNTTNTTDTSTTMGGGPMYSGPGNYRTVAYFVNWAIYGRKHRPQDLPAEQLTHVLYAFANVRPETGEVYLTDGWADTDIRWADAGDTWDDAPGTTNLYGCLTQLNLLKRRNRNLKVLLSVGGWTYSANFRQPASTPHGRAEFARSCVRLLADLGFDGIDVDWEYPATAQEAADWVALLRAVRAEMDAYADATRRDGDAPYHFELSVACPAGPQNFERLDVPAMDRVLDFWNLMAYDYAGSWDAVAGHQANLFPAPPGGGDPAATPFSTAAAVDFYVNRGGVHPSKLVLGMPLYGRAFVGTDGPGRPYTGGVGEGSWERGVYDYKALPLAGAAEHVDDRVGASYCYDPRARTMVSYDTLPMARAKARFLRDWALGGAMWWESSADKPGPESLVANVVDVLGGAPALDAKPNCIDYPRSKYDNLRNGFSGQ